MGITTIRSVFTRVTIVRQNTTGVRIVHRRRDGYWMQSKDLQLGSFALVAAAVVHWIGEKYKTLDWREIQNIGLERNAKLKGGEVMKTR